MDSYLWTGYTCLTGGGRYAAAWFGPAEMTNDPYLTARGAFLAIVDLQTGGAALVDQRVALIRSAVGCGPRDEVAALRGDGDGVGRTEVFSVRATDATAGPISTLEAVARHPAPTGSHVYLSTGIGVVDVARPGEPVATALAGEVVDLQADEQGGVRVARLDRGTVSIHDLPPGSAELGPEIAAGPVGHLELAQGVGGRSVVVGRPTHLRRGIPAMRTDELPDAVSLDGSVAVALGDDRSRPSAQDPAADASVAIVAQPSGGSPEPSAELSLTAADADPIATFTGPASPCAVPRNDPAVQVVQPSPQQVEWAAHKAVRVGVPRGGVSRRR
jgi:hypothetical protein